MDSDVFTDQGGLPIHGIRDVGSTVDGKQHDWSEQAEATETDTLSTDLKSYISTYYICLSVCLSVTTTEMSKMLSRRGAVMPTSSSVSDSVKKRYFNTAETETNDCSFATITLPFQRTLIIPHLYMHAVFRCN